MCNHMPSCSDNREELLPMADIVTPNLKEASALLGGVPLETIADMHYAAKAIHDIGPRLVLRFFFSFFFQIVNIDALTLYYL